MVDEPFKNVNNPHDILVKVDRWHNTRRGTEEHPWTPCWDCCPVCDVANPYHDAATTERTLRWRGRYEGKRWW